jgi:choice-of-anchor B domain-containing protein
MGRLGKYLLFIAFFSLFVLRTSSQSAWNAEVKDIWSATGIPLNSLNGGYSDMCGFELNGRRYAALCSTAGVHVVELSSSGQIIERGFVPGAFQAATVVNRDVAVYRTFLYAVCDHGPSTLQVVDLQYLPDSVHVVWETDQFFQRAHSLVVDTSAAKLLACGVSSTSTGERAMDVFSLSNPATPLLLGSFTSIQYVHDAFSRNDTAWLNCAYDGLIVVKFSDPFGIQIIGDLPTYPDDGYNHSGFLSASGMHYVFTDETAGKRIKFCDVSDVNDIQVISLFHSGTNSQNMAHNVWIKDHFVFVSHYRDGLQVFDLSQPANPIKVAWYDPHEQDGFPFSGAWGIHVWQYQNEVLISDMQLGLIWLKLSLPPLIHPDELPYSWFPNPSNGITWFQKPSQRNFPMHLQVFDLSGKLVLERTIPAVDRFSIDVSRWSPGVYYYNVAGISTEVFYTGKLVVTGQ